MIIDRWDTDSLPFDSVRIYPDGCREVIWFRLPGKAPCWKLSGLDVAVRQLHGAAGAAMRGYRLAPGCVVDEAALLAALDPEKPDELAAIGEEASLPADVAELVQAFRFAAAGGVGRSARRLGVSIRTLQRHCCARTGQSPLFWLRLLRLRQALCEARDGASLAEAAAGAGFADQSHFTREAGRFYGATPARLLADRQALPMILAPGL